MDSPDAPSIVALFGDEHPDLGPIHVETLGNHTAIGLSAGRLPKSYWHLDPNEDGVLAISRGAVRVLAVADGHSGFDAAYAALTGVLEQAGADHRRQAPQELLALCLRAAGSMVTRSLREVGPSRANSRTALSIAVVTPTEVHAATFGDTAVVRVRDGQGRRLGGVHEFLGPRSSPARRTSTQLRPGDIVVGMSDGVTDYLGRAWLQRVAATASSTSPAQAVRQLLELAGAGGAGDHQSMALTTV